MLFPSLLAQELGVASNGCVGFIMGTWFRHLTLFPRWDGQHPFVLIGKIMGPGVGNKT